MLYSPRHVPGGTKCRMDRGGFRWIGGRWSPRSRPPPSSRWGSSPTYRG